jgi:MFS family permease
MRKPLWTYLACCIAVFMIAMDNLIVTNALPVIRQTLHTGLEGLEWTVNAYTLTFAVLLLTGAALPDRFGRRRLMAIGITVFTAGSAASALASSIGGRRIVAIGVALQAIGIGWLATEITPTIPYADLVPPFLIAGTGLGFFFAPITQLTLRYAPGQLEGIASGTSNALRQVGTVLGIAVLGSVFSATGSLGSPDQFTTGLTAALTVSAAILGASALVVLLAPETRTARQAAVGAGAGAGLVAGAVPVAMPAVRRLRRLRCLGRV